MRTILLGTLLACVLAACGGDVANNTGNTPAATCAPVVDLSGPTEVAKQLLEAAMKGDEKAAKAFMLEKERLAEGKGMSFNINDKGNMKGYEIGEPKMEGENAIVPATVTFTDDTPTQTMDLVMQKEGDAWRVSMGETLGREFKKRIKKD